MRLHDLTRSLFGAALLVGLTACPSDDASEPADTEGQDTEAQQLPEGCDFYVEVGDNGQEDLITALVDVQPAQTVCMGPGTFTLTRQLTITTDDVTLRGAGMDMTILDFSQQISGGNGVLIESDRTVIEDFSVVDTPGDAVRSNDVDGGTYRRIKAGWTAEASLDNGAYALYPVQSRNIHVDSCVAYHARDAGLYIGQSENVLIENSEAYGNVIGIEIENTTDSVVRNNNSHDNTNGILVITLPGLDILDGKRANIHGNTLTNNNVPNFGDPGTTVGLMPPGVGVLVVAADNNEIWDNDISGNNSIGIAVIGYLEPLLGAPNDPNFDVYSQGNYFHDNRLSNNATDVDQLVQTLNGLQNPGPEVLTDGCWDEAAGPMEGMLANCLKIGNASFLNADLCNQAGGANMDEAPFDCVQTALPTDIPGVGGQ
jgi:parallel beta-helix repeat protein